MCDGAKAFQENINALYAESRKLIRYDGRVNFVTFLTYLHAELYLLPISHIIIIIIIMYDAHNQTPHPSRLMMSVSRSNDAQVMLWALRRLPMLTYLTTSIYLFILFIHY